MTDKLREAAQQALEALEEFCETGTMLRPIERRDALRTALAEPQEDHSVKDSYELIMKWADIYAAETGNLYAEAARDPSKTARMPDERTMLGCVVAQCLSTPPPKAEPQEPDEVKQIAEALRQVGLTLIRTGAGFRVADLGRVEAQTAPQPKVEQQEPVLVVEKEPDYWSGGHFHKGDKPHIDPTKVWGLQIGTKLYTAPRPRKRLTIEEINALPEAQGDWPMSMNDRIVKLIRAVEAAVWGDGK